MMEAGGRALQRRRVLGALAGLLFAGVAGAGLLAQRPRARGTESAVPAPAEPAEPARRLTVVRPWSEKRCETYPWLMMKDRVYGHLGRVGPVYGGDSDRVGRTPVPGDSEGLVFRTMDMGTAAGEEEGRKVLLILNATNDDYEPFSPKMNGMSGFYGSVNVKSGTHLDLKIHFRDQKTNKRLTMEELAITFFDLDQGHKNRSQESVAINKFENYYLMQDTEVQVSKQPHGMTKFTSSTFGSGDDNPKDPMLLNAQQRNRAVTLLYKNLDEIDVTIAASPNIFNSPRFFTFVLRPSLFCTISKAKKKEAPEAPLEHTPPMEWPVPVDKMRWFNKWLVNLGDEVKKDQPIASVYDRDDKEIDVKASVSGKLVKKANLLHNENCRKRLTDTTIAVIKIEKIAPLKVDDDTDMAAVAPHGSTFVKFKVPVGAYVEKGDPVAAVLDHDDKPATVDAPRNGVIAAEQTEMKEGDPIERIDDHNLAAFGRLAPLKVNASAGETATEAPEGVKFVKFNKKKGDIVQIGETVATVMNAQNEEVPVKAKQPGAIARLQDKLQKGYTIDRVLKDRNLATIGKLPPLAVSDGQGTVTAPPGPVKLKEWKKNEGDVVEKGDTIAVIEDDKGVEKKIPASQNGQIVDQQTGLKPGDRIDKTMTDTDLEVIGPLPEIKPKKWSPLSREIGVTFPKEPPGIIFKDWKVKKGEHVEMGDAIAEVQLPGRRLADGRMLAGNLVTVKSPVWGTVKEEQPLKAGEPIEKQQAGANIAILDMGVPWWSYLIGALALICFTLCCIFAVMKKPKPYIQIPPVEEEPAAPTPEPEQVPEGLRLDFEEDGEVHTVYAKYRPLGIKHEDVAPIIAHAFTLNSYAKQELGVKNNWKLRRIGDEELEDNPNFREVNEKLHGYMKDFPLWPLPMEFQDDKGYKRSCSFAERPVGFEFTNQAPLKVAKVYDNSPAAEQGVQEGWDVVKIGEMDVLNNEDFREIMGYLHEGVLPLDHKGKSYQPSQ